MNSLLILGFLICSNLFAQNLQVGVSEQSEELSLNVKELNFFTYKDAYRYGYGSGGIELGDHLTFRGKSAGGTPVYGVTKNLAFVAELGNVDVAWSTDDHVRSHYTLMPGMGLGYISVQNEKPFELYLIPKGGLAVTNLFSHRFLSPGTTAYYGIHGFATINQIFFGLVDFVRLKEDYKLRTYTISYRSDPKQSSRMTIMLEDNQLGKVSETKTTFLFTWSL